MLLCIKCVHAKNMIERQNIVQPSQIMHLTDKMQQDQSTPSHAINNQTPSNTSTHSSQLSQKPLSNIQSQDTIKNNTYAYFSNGASVQEALIGFANNYGIPIIISNKITNIMNGKLGPLKAVPFLNLLSQLNQLIWYFDGNTLYIYNSNELKTEMMKLEFINSQMLKNTLSKMKYWDAKFNWSTDTNNNFISISGPPRYIDLIKKTIEELEKSAKNRAQNKLDFITFPLQYAWAADRTITYRNQSILIPGVASILNNMIFDNNDNITTSSIIPNNPTHSNSLEALNPIQTQSKTLNASISSNKGIHNPNIKIQAEPRSNSILVYDLSSKKSMYQKLIQLLDKPSAQIEINVSIIDIDTNSFSELGIHWSFGSEDSKLQFNPSTPSNSQTILNLAESNLAAKIKALSTTSKAKILSRPSVITLDNMEAILDNSQTFYVSVNGNGNTNSNAALYPITSGSVLKVRPHIITENQKFKIQLDVNIQDGASQSSNLGGVSLPIVKNTTINTQAIIHEGESLLVGGYYYEKKSTTGNQVPFLSKLPIIGKLLFKEKGKAYTKNVRLFLITPKVVRI